MKYRKKLRKNYHSKRYKIDKRREYSECKRKKGFATTREVNRIIQIAYAESGIKLDYYQCTYCGKYHLTKKFVTDKFQS